MALNSSSHIRNKVILTESTQYLESNHPILPSFGLSFTLFRVIDGLDTLDLLEKVEVNHKHRPLKELHLKNVTIHANPLADENIQF